MNIDKDCVFCKIVRKELQVKIVYESENFLAFPDAHPKVPGHTLIIPKKHFISIIDLPSDLGSELLDVIKRIFEIKKCEGFNLIMNNFPAAGQLVMHAHMHFLPRKKGDRGFQSI